MLYTEDRRTSKDSGLFLINYVLGALLTGGISLIQWNCHSIVDSPSRGNCLFLLSCTNHYSIELLIRSLHLNFPYPTLHINKMVPWFPEQKNITRKGEETITSEIWIINNVIISFSFFVFFF